jgi:hypothetical protein
MMEMCYVLLKARLPRRMNLPTRITVDPAFGQMKKPFEEE